MEKNIVKECAFFILIYCKLKLNKNTSEKIFIVLEGKIIILRSYKVQSKATFLSASYWSGWKPVDVDLSQYGGHDKC